MKYWNFVCSKCGNDKYIKKYEEDQFYVCEKCGSPEAFHCDECEELYEDMNRLGLKDDVYVCKKCGKIQWGYTQWMRDKK